MALSPKLSVERTIANIDNKIAKIKQRAEDELKPLELQRKIMQEALDQMQHVEPELPAEAPAEEQEPVSQEITREGEPAALPESEEQA